jgi:hypothetical protein
LSTKRLGLLNFLIDYIKKTYRPTTKTLGVKLLLKDNVDTDLKDNEGRTLLWAVQKGLLLKQKDVDPNFPDSGKFDLPEFDQAELPPAITWQEFDLQELPAPPDLSAITWLDIELNNVFGRFIIFISSDTSC